MTTKTHYIGIDPGANGAWACSNGSKFLFVEDLPNDGEGFDAGEFFLQLQSIDGPIVAVLERPLPFLVNNADSILKLGQSYGALKALLATRSDIKIVTPTARSWKLSMRLTAEKGLSVERAREVLGLADNARLRHDKAEAVLLCEYGRRFISVPGGHCGAQL